MRQYRSTEIKEYVGKLTMERPALMNKAEIWPKISVVIPSFNQAEYIERTIVSILNQNYPNLELIIMDGGSTDGSREIIKRYDKYIDCWLSEKDQGQGDAIQKGFDRSTGEILAWLNSDDVYMPGALFKVGQAFIKHPAVDVVYGNEYILGASDQIIKERRVSSGLPIFSKLGFLAGNFGYYQPAAFWKKQLYCKVGKIDPSFRFAMDNDLFARFDLAGAKYHFIREFLSGFRVHPGSKTTNLQDIARQELITIYGKYKMPKPHKSIIRMNLYRIVKIGLYLIQGDCDWLSRSLYGRMLRGEKFNL